MNVLADEVGVEATPTVGEEKDGGRRMFVEVRIKMEVDTDKWAETYDTTGQKASDVRKDIRDWARDCVFDEGEPLGIEPSNEVG